MVVAAPITAGAARAAPCTAVQMSFAHVASNTWGTGRAGWIMRLTNRSPTACVLSRRPRLTFGDQTGRIPFVIVYRRRCPWTYGCSRPLTTPSAPLRVDPRRSVYFAFDSYRCDLGTKRDADVVQLDVRGSLVLRLGERTIVSWCGRGDPGSSVTVSPFERTIRLAVERG